MLAQEVVEVRSVPAQGVVGDHEVVFHERKLEQPVGGKGPVSPPGTHPPPPPMTRRGRTERATDVGPAPASPLSNDLAPRVRGVHEVPQVVVGHDDPARLLRQVEQEPGGGGREQRVS